MENPLEKEVQRLKDELAKKRAEIQDIARLVGEEIDRRFSLHPVELSERELDSLVTEKLEIAKQSIDINLKPEELTSHRKILGRPILFLKRKFMRIIRFYTELLASKQNRFNDNTTALLEAIYTHSKRQRQELRDVQEKISRLEETVVLFLARLKEIKEEMGRKKSEGSKE